MLNIYEITIKPEWFEYINNGQKTYEGRLFKGMFTQIGIDDIITWKYYDKWNNKWFLCKTKVFALVKYPTFEVMLKTLGLRNTLPPIRTIDEGIALYKNFFSIADQRKYGVIAIGLEKI